MIEIVIILLVSVNKSYNLLIIRFSLIFCLIRAQLVKNIGSSFVEELSLYISTSASIIHLVMKVDSNYYLSNNAIALYYLLVFTLALILEICSFNLYGFLNPFSWKEYKTKFLKPFKLLKYLMAKLKR